jgi:two-component system, OmpR family, response regulator
MVRLCVVEDEPQLLRLLQRLLQDAGFTADGVVSGSSAITALGERRYDLALLDLGLPDVDGVDLLQVVHQHHPDLQVMVVSAHDDPATKVRCLDLGACDFVGKPFDVAELLARVRARLRPLAHQASGEFLRCGAARLDLLRHRLLLPNATVALPPREFLLLRHLMTKRGEICSRNELLNAVWGYAFETDTNVVDVYVSRLRSKLPPRMIETIRNVGYSFVAE